MAKLSAKFFQGSALIDGSGGLPIDQYEYQTGFESLDTWAARMFYRHGWGCAIFYVDGTASSSRSRSRESISGDYWSRMAGRINAGGAVFYSPTQRGGIVPAPIAIQSASASDRGVCLQLASGVSHTLGICDRVQFPAPVGWGSVDTSSEDPERFESIA